MQPIYVLEGDEIVGGNIEFIISVRSYTDAIPPKWLLNHRTRQSLMWEAIENRVVAVTKHREDALQDHQKPQS